MAIKDRDPSALIIIASLCLAALILIGTMSVHILRSNNLKSPPPKEATELSKNLDALYTKYEEEGDRMYKLGNEACLAKEFNKAEVYYDQAAAEFYLATRRLDLTAPMAEAKLIYLKSRVAITIDLRNRCEKWAKGAQR
jgi:hypothetical protein